jgi:hypothetical protein
LKQEPVWNSLAEVTLLLMGIYLVTLQQKDPLRPVFFVIILSGVRLSPLGTAATTGLLYQPRMIDDGDCGAIDGMKIGRRNQSTWRQPAPVPLCSPQIPHDLTRARTLAAVVLL